MKNRAFRDEIVMELESLKEIDLADDAVINAVKNGEFDKDIDEVEDLSCTDATDLILDIHRIRQAS
jgi:hypothetical protein